MDFHELRAALAPLGFKRWLDSYDTLVRRGDGSPDDPDIYIEQEGWGGPGRALVKIHGIRFGGTFDEIAKEMATWVKPQTH